MTLTSDLVFRIIVPRAYLILLKVGILNSVCGCNFGLRSVTNHFPVILTLTFDLFCRIIMSRTYLLYYLRWNPKFVVLDTSLDAGVSHTIFRSL